MTDDDVVLVLVLIAALHQDQEIVRAAVRKLASRCTPAQADMVERLGDLEFPSLGIWRVMVRW